MPTQGEKPSKNPAGCFDEPVTTGRLKEILGDFAELARRSINPNRADAAVEEMLIQHLLTERLIRTDFNKADFSLRNIIAAEIEKVIAALASPKIPYRQSRSLWAGCDTICEI